MTLISVITVVRNNKDGLRDTADSLANQRFTDFEWIVIDGASTDGTAECGPLLSQQPTVWISEPDMGIYDAMNKGLSVSEGDWIYFLNAGDTLCEQGSLDFVASWVRGTDLDWGFGAVRNIDSAGNATGFQCPSPFTTTGLALGNSTVPHQATFMRRSLTTSLGRFLIDAGTAADQEYILRAALAGPPFEMVWPIANFRLGGVGMNKQGAHFPQAMRRMRRKRGVNLFGSRIADEAVTAGVVVKTYVDSIQDSIARRLSN